MSATAAHFSEGETDKINKLYKVKKLLMLKMKHIRLVVIFPILTNSLNPGGDARTGHNLRDYQATHLRKEGLHIFRKAKKVIHH